MARVNHITCRQCRVSLHTSAYDYHEHNTRRKPLPRDSVSCPGCPGTGLIQGAQAHYLGGRVIRCPRCFGYGWIRSDTLARPSPRGGVSILKPQADPQAVSPSEHERLIETVEQVVTDAEEEAEEQRAARQREQAEEQERRKAEERRRDDVGNGPTVAPGMNADEVDQSLDRQRRRDEAAQDAKRKGRLGRFVRRGLAVLALGSVLVMLGGGAVAFITGATFDEIVDAVEERWTAFRGGDTGAGAGLPASQDPLPVVAPPTASPTPTATLTPTPAPTATPTATPVPLPTWGNFTLSFETLGKDIVDRLSDEEIDCLRTINADAFYQNFLSQRFGELISAYPPIRSTNNLTELSRCLSFDSDTQLNQAITQFHESPPSTPEPTPTPAPTPEPPPPATTPEVSPTVEPTVKPKPTARATTSPATERMDRLRQLALDLINADRKKHGVAPVTLGTNEAAQMHAQDMLTNDYQGHWWADGRKPYMVYTQTGGTSYASENAASSGWKSHEWAQAGCGSFLVRCTVPTPEEAIRDLQWLMMYDDAHADWGHRDNILRETHRAVNIGIAWNNRRVTFIQHFEGGAVTADAPPSLEDGRILSLAVTKNETGIRIGGLVSVYYDPPPIPVSRELNDSLDSYCIGGGATTNCPRSAIRILDPPGAGYYYSSLDSNEVVASSWRETTTSFSFSVDVGRLMEDPGVYTVMLWRDEGGSQFTESLLSLSVFVD